ncbi:hypothetical protein WMY93_022549 [Mugilogobius chulae]|uniref:Rho-GAP domain-containing protein n=1 Tax=Mugilogobius chulae TaxID=88201 RepID=A0AAW0NHE9_9GOBI
MRILNSSQWETRCFLTGRIHIWETSHGAACLVGASASPRMHPEPVRAGTSPPTRSSLHTFAPRLRPGMPNHHAQRWSEEEEVSEEKAGLSAKEKSKDKESIPQAFSIPLSQVIANDRAHRQRQDGYRHDPPAREEHKDSLISSRLLYSLPQSVHPIKSYRPVTRPSAPRPKQPTSPPPPTLQKLPQSASKGRHVCGLHHRLGRQPVPSPRSPTTFPSRRNANKKEKQRDKRLSLNPIYRQVPRVVDSCCQHLEKYGLQTVGIFRVGSSKKRVRQLREEFDRGIDVQLDEDHSVHDVAALLKEFLRDMPDPLLTKELYTAFINTTLLEPDEQQNVTQLLIYLLPACNSDTLHRLLEFLSTVADHAHDQQDKDGQEITGTR